MTLVDINPERAGLASALGCGFALPEAALKRATNHAYADPVRQQEPASAPRVRQVKAKGT